MTAGEVIKRFQQIRPSGFSDGELLQFLNGAESELYMLSPEARVVEDEAGRLPPVPAGASILEVRADGVKLRRLSAGERGPGYLVCADGDIRFIGLSPRRAEMRYTLAFEPIGEGQADERQLLLSDRWEDLYTYYLSAETELFGGSVAAYTNFALLYNGRLAEYRRERYDALQPPYSGPAQFQNLY